jgi:hypothetical protein
LLRQWENLNLAVVFHNLSSSLVRLHLFTGFGQWQMRLSAGRGIEARLRDAGPGNRDYHLCSWVHSCTYAISLFDSMQLAQGFVELTVTFALP